MDVSVESLLAKTLQKASDALDALNPEKLSSKDISNLIDVAIDLGWLKKESTDDSEERPCVHVYLPDNGRSEDGPGDFYV